MILAIQGQDHSVYIRITEFEKMTYFDKITGYGSLCSIQHDAGGYGQILQSVAIKNTPLRIMGYCRSGSELSCQIFRHCSLNSLPSALLVSLHLLQYF